MKKLTAVAGLALVALSLAGCATGAEPTSPEAGAASPEVAESSMVRVVIFDNATDENILIIEGNCTPFAEPDALTLTCYTAPGDNTERTFDLTGDLCDSVERLEGKDEYHYLEVSAPETVPAPVGDIEYSCDAERNRR